MKAFAAVMVVFFLGVLVYMYPDPSWKFGRSTTYKWSESIFEQGVPKTLYHCYAWSQQDQTWQACQELKESGSEVPSHVEWSDQSMQVFKKLPPK